MTGDKIYWEQWPKPTLEMQMRHLAEAVQEAYNEFKRGYCEDGRQVTLFYYKFKEYEIQPGQPDRTPRRLKKREVQITL